MMNIPIEDHIRRKELYDQGLNDRQIGERLFLSTQAIYQLRKACRYPANTLANGRRYITDYAERMKLYREGKNDAEIAMAQNVDKSTIWHWRRMHDREVAEMFHLHPGTVTNWRKKHGIPANGKRGSR